MNETEAKPQHWSQFRVGTWFVLVALLAFFIVTVGGDKSFPLYVWPFPILLAFASWKGFWRLMQRHRELLEPDNE